MKKYGLNTICTHEGEIYDVQFKSAVSPLYMATSYEYDGVVVKRYPRYFNTPNQEAVAKKIAALEHTEEALIFGSGMAAISTSLLAFLKKGHHAVFQKNLYGGSFNFITKEFEKFGIGFSFTEGLAREDFEKAMEPNTKVIYIETPSNPLLGITDMRAIASLARERGSITMIDNTFASPVNQNPVDWGIDVVIHSATKYLGGHSDILAGAVAGSAQHIALIYEMAKSLGGSLSDYTVWLLERSLKTLGLRVKAQNQNAEIMAGYLVAHPAVKKVYYPGLQSHPGYEVAKGQMRGFGGVVSFELREGIDALAFQRALQLIKPSMSLAGVESSMLMPSLTSHAVLSPEERLQQGITDGLIRFSVGIEEAEDLIGDIEQALNAMR